MVVIYHNISNLLHHACKLLCTLVLLCSALCGLTSCHWHEARKVIALADSLDRAEHVVYDDTAALSRTIRCLDNPFGRVLMSNTLGKAYYYMGKNFSFANQIANAADCYIKADRLQIDDPTYRGRGNSNMAYICARNGNDNLALIFYQRALASYKMCSNEWRHAHTLLNISECNINLHHYNAADSLLQIAQSFC